MKVMCMLYEKPHHLYEKHAGKLRAEPWLCDNYWGQDGLLILQLPREPYNDTS